MGYVIVAIQLCATFCLDNVYKMQNHALIITLECWPVIILARDNDVKKINFIRFLMDPMEVHKCFRIKWLRGKGTKSNK